MSHQGPRGYGIMVITRRLEPKLEPDPYRARAGPAHGGNWLVRFEPEARAEPSSRLVSWTTLLRTTTRVTIAECKQREIEGER